MMKARTKNATDGGKLGGRRAIVQSRKTVETGGAGGAKINCNH